MTPDDVKIEQRRDGLRITVADDATDSLAIIDVSQRHNTLGVRTGLRGNLDAHKRPLRWSSQTMNAPPVSAQERYQRALNLVRRRPAWLDPTAFAGYVSRLRDRADAERGEVCQCWNEGQWGRVHREDCPIHKDGAR